MLNEECQMLSVEFWLSKFWILNVECKMLKLIVENECKMLKLIVENECKMLKLIVENWM